MMVFLMKFVKIRYAGMLPVSYTVNKFELCWLFFPKLGHLGMSDPSPVNLDPLKRSKGDKIDKN